MNARNKLILSMFIFGTIGIFVHYLPFPSSFIAMVRGFVGAAFLLLLIAVKKQKVDLKAIRANFVLLIILGAALGFNWILLFEAYKYTTVATATLCYYLAPIFVMAISPFVLKERLTVRKTICILVALLGMVFVSGVLSTGFGGGAEYKGVLLGMGAACLYALIMVLNKKLHDISGYDRTVMQLAVAGIVLLPYVLLTENVGSFSFTGGSVALLAFVGIVHTGVAYALYFASMKDLPAQTVAIFSYIDPITAILLSELLLKEPMGINGIIGAVLVLGATFVSELPEKQKCHPEQSEDHSLQGR